MKDKIFNILAMAMLLSAVIPGLSKDAHAAPLSDNGNGTVTDSRTGLIWQQGEPGKMTWDSAVSYCEGLTLGGDSDWRLPNIKALESLTDDSRYNPAIDTNFFPKASASVYLASTTYVSYPGNAWTVNLNYGYVSYVSKILQGSGMVRCVRGGQYDNCAANLSSSDLSMHIPILDFAGSHYWADFTYVSGLDFTIVNAGEILDLGPYNACAHATLSETTQGVHIPDLLFGGTSYWADFAYKNGLTVTLGNAGAN